MAEHGRQCLTCEAVKPLDDFTLQQHTRKDGSKYRYPSAHCKPCYNARSRKRYRPDLNRGYSLKRRYGITSEQFDAMLLAQGGCAACGSATTDGKYWHVDHDHACCDTQARSCGKCIRAILCHGCNTALGNVKDDKARLVKLIAYLEGFE